MTDSELLYDEQHISFLEDMWGDGFLSPGGADEAKLVVEGLDLRGKRILDIGSGSGAIGIMQIKPSTAADRNVGIPDITAPADNIRAGARYMRFLMDRYFSKWDQYKRLSQWERNQIEQLDQLKRQQKQKREADSVPR